MHAHVSHAPCAQQAVSKSKRTKKGKQGKASSVKKNDVCHPWAKLQLGLNSKGCSKSNAECKFRHGFKNAEERVTVHATLNK